MVGAYLWNLRSLANRGFSLFSQNIAGGIATVLTTASATFKLAFTSQDSPELMASPKGPLIAGELSLSLVTRARIVFAAIGVALVYTFITGFSLKKRPNRKYLLPILSDILLIGFSHNEDGTRSSSSISHHPVQSN